MSEVKAYCEFYNIVDSWVKGFLVLFVSELNCELLDYKEVQRERERKLKR